ncbi:MAG TPA: tail fiber domain-containing protein [Verrucomicrobiota bacterium]|nr:hypothetical protein [Verrucomicrobiales bacterium]HRI14181.1 tail fiber domain-containing protein [Verrucomicrobiota bacterium]
MNPQSSLWQLARLTAALAVLLPALTRAAAQVPPGMLSYQGRLVVGTTNFDGTGHFKFSLINGTNGPTLWSNDGTPNGEPNQAVALPVTKGLYQVLLGDRNDPALSGMTTNIPSAVFANPDVRLRVWFSSAAAGPFEQLAPDYRIASVGYALMAAEVPDGSITTAKLPPNVVLRDILGGIQAKSVQATYFIGSGVALTNLNASNILSGTLADDRLSANVARVDRGQEFSAANVFSNPSNRFVGTGAGLSDLDAAKILTGTVADQRLSTNVVVRDALGGIQVRYAQADLFVGNGAALTNLNASTGLTGIVADAQLSPNVARLDRNQVFSGQVVLGNPANRFVGDGVGLTDLDASKITTGTLGNQHLSPTVVVADSAGQVRVRSLDATELTGGGGGLINLNANAISIGTLSEARLSPNVARINRDQEFSSVNVFSNPSNRFVGTGAELNNLNASNILSGILADERLSTNVVLRDEEGNVSAGLVSATGFAGDGSRLRGLNADEIRTGTLADARLSPRVARVDLANVFTHPDNQFFGQGGGLTNLNASALRSGTIPPGRLPASVARINISQTFSGTNTFTNIANRFVGNGAGLTLLNAQALTNGPLPDSLLSSNVLRRDADDAIAAPRFSLPTTMDTNTGVLTLGDAVFLHALGVDNTFVGSGAGSFSGRGARNTALGSAALESLTTGNQNSALGFGALRANATGNDNSALGVGALAGNTTGEANVASGNGSLAANTSGSRNIGLGRNALSGNTTGNDNVAVGYEAGSRLTTGDDNIMIGAPGVPDDAKTIRIGQQGIQTQTIIAGIYSNTIPDGLAVRIDAEGKLGVLSSSRRYKEAIRDMANESEVILAMRPVEFRYKPDIDPQGLVQFGLIAEEVDQIAPQLVARGSQGEIQSVRYEAVNAMMLNEVKKQHLRLAEQEQAIGDMKQQISELNNKLAEATALLQRVAGQLSSVAAPAVGTISTRIPEGR